MGVLPYQDIKDFIDKGVVIKNADPSKIQACSYDLRVGTIFSSGEVLKSNEAKSILKPGGILSVFTLEEIDLPHNICATVFPINKQSSRGLLVLNPGHIDPGFQGSLTVKLLNISRESIIVKRSEPIFTIVFSRLDQPTSKPYQANKQQGERENEFAANDLNCSPLSLTKLVGEPDELRVNELIRNHWISWTVLASGAGLPHSDIIKERAQACSS
jgi:deoxycytidine triphosphate deaminase